MLGVGGYRIGFVRLIELIDWADFWEFRLVSMGARACGFLLSRFALYHLNAFLYVLDRMCLCCGTRSTD